MSISEHSASAVTPKKSLRCAVEIPTATDNAIVCNSWNIQRVCKHCGPVCVSCIQSFPCLFSADGVHQPEDVEPAFPLAPAGEPQTLNPGDSVSLDFGLTMAAAIDLLTGGAQ